jgi:hypothetical protein
MSIVLMSTGVADSLELAQNRNPSEFVFYAAGMSQETGTAGRYV